MIPYRYHIIAREGRLPLLAFFTLAILLHYYYRSPVVVLPWLAFAVTLFLFRDPVRKIPPSPLGIVAPVDSTVVSVGKMHDPYADREAIRIRLRNNILGVYAVRSPMEGKVTKQWFNSVPETKRATGIREGGTDDDIPPFAQWVTSDEGDDVVMALTPRMNITPSRCSVHSGERVGQGQRCTFIPLGADADVYLPVNSRVEVKENDTVQAGCSIIATLVH